MCITKYLPSKHTPLYPPQPQIIVHSLASHWGITLNVWLHSNWSPGGNTTGEVTFPASTHSMCCQPSSSKSDISLAFCSHGFQTTERNKRISWLCCCYHSCIHVILLLCTPQHHYYCSHHQNPTAPWPAAPIGSTPLEKTKTILGL